MIRIIKFDELFEGCVFLLTEDVQIYFPNGRYQSLKSGAAVRKVGLLLELVKIEEVIE